MGTNESQKTVGDLMTDDPLVIAADAPLAEAERVIQHHRITGLPVVDSDGEVVGVIAQSDILHARSTEPFATDWPGLRVSALMTSPALTVEAQTAVGDAARLMDERRVHRLVVIGPGSRTPIGVLTTTDLVRAVGGGELSG